MSMQLVIAEGRQHDLLSKASRRAAQLFRTRTFRPAAPMPLVSFTFDDIPDSAAINGADVLERHDARGTFYVSAGLCGNRAAGNSFATREAVRALALKGHEIGCHTYSHPDVQQLTGANLAYELERNALVMRAFAPEAVLTNFAYPYGSVGLTQKRVVQRRFRSARGTRQGVNQGAIDLGHLLAVRLYDNLLDRHGIDALVREAVANKGWLIFYTHDVCDQPSLHGCTPGLLATALDICRRHACPVATIDAALDRLAA